MRSIGYSRRGALLLALSGLVSACAPGRLQWGSRSLDFPTPGAAIGGGAGQPNPTLPPAGGAAGSGRVETFGRGPVPVSLLLPLSGEPALAQMGLGLANAARLAIAFIEANPNIGENITITLRDTGDGAAGASTAARAAVAGGAQLLLGPLKGEQVAAAAAVAQAAGVPLIGFSNAASVAGPGVYLLAVLPEMEMKRAIGFLKAEGRRGLAGIFPTTPHGEALATAFRQQAIAAGFSPSAVYMFSAQNEAAQIAAQAKPLVASGMIDALFLPERASAPAFATALNQAGIVGNELLQLVGSADWAGDAAILSAPGLQGAIYPAVDETGLNAIAPDYAARFGGRPPALSTIAYTGVILANVNRLSLARPAYSPALMTAPAGFSGRDGAFRFLSNGRAEYALAIKRVTGGGAVSVEAARI
ncbi:MAG: hypothetical protein KIS86_03930 [Devosia sp.]|nr:hypothetical protein [Devosia sp.]